MSFFQFLSYFMLSMFIYQVMILSVSFLFRVILVYRHNKKTKEMFKEGLKMVAPDTEGTTWQ